ncbi:MFS transporter [Companilactobacillus ginsenosidimutans]|uniref:Multidrug MFS transporter n=1 Tax=Companilactobacillus ginsenosidimutans TaxID=1007676 RepID=A0A0H4QJH9_9LACO|nr:MFS transporter [Companilactobacillus ginsenosidimutans]AKP67196.1 multidrug MFS transporter [Companilactobacillus ginsenosidimutans]
MNSTKQKNSRRWLALTALCIAVFMSLLDSTIVNVALPTIQQELKVSYAELQWVMNAYTLAFAMCLLLASKFGDLFGRKRIFLITLSIFTLGSLGSSMSQTALFLNVFRMIQGIGGAGMMSLSMTIVTETFDDNERGLAFGVWSSVVGVATALGPVIGGYLIKIFTWRSIFYINLPIGIIALLMAYKFVDESYGNKEEKIDWWGMIISTVMIFCLVFGLVQKETHINWTWMNSQVISYFIIGIVLVIVFIILEKRIKEPMINLEIFKSWSFNGTAIASFCLGAGLYAFFTYMTIWMQSYLRYTPEQTGIRQLAIGLMSLIIGPIAGILSNRLAKRWLIGGGLIIIALGLFEIQRVVSLQVTYLDYVSGFIIIGIGNAIVNPPLSAAAMESVDPNLIGIASGVVNVFRQLGSTFGIVILGLVLSNGYQNGLNRYVGDLALAKSTKSGIINELISAGPTGSEGVLRSAWSNLQQLDGGSGLFASLKAGVWSGFDVGYVLVIGVSIFICLFGAVVALVSIRDRR